ncbi:uncharacterized protein LOC121728232 [Aricia agestis]|uniref:uncharacterized protein LOC121728232 n=1 Tax=Aricia agestis TaxID=91739 RepID=UPI001C20306D|nr:uncharacterized protein LOC121728232 [Aricia agestis]
MNNNLIELTTETLEAIRKSHNLDDPDRRKEAVDALREWVMKQEHLLKKDFTDRYLEWRILTRKGSVERAKHMIDKICTLRTLYPHFFGVFNVKKDLKNIEGNIVCFALPEVINTDVRVYIVKFYNREPISSYFTNFLRYVLLARPVLWGSFIEYSKYCG